MLHVYQPFEATIPQLFEFDVHNKIHYEDTTYSETLVGVFRFLNIYYKLLQILSIALKIIAKLLQNLIIDLYVEK